jgi:VWFA-related protein
MVPFSVLDDGGRPVSGLTPIDFRTFEDGIEQRIEYIDSQKLPVCTALISDVSDSMADRTGLSRTWMMAFLNSASQGDEFLLVEFSSRVTLIVNQTPNPDDIRRALLPARTSGRTSLLDGIYFSARTILRSDKPRRVLIVLSDGGDNHSRYTEHEVENLLSESGAIVYMIGVLGPHRMLAPETRSGPQMMADIAARTGGRYYAVKDPGDAFATADRVAAEIGNSYVLAYSSAKRDGQYHSVRVCFRNPSDAKRLHVSWRQGYYADSQP